MLIFCSSAVRRFINQDRNFIFPVVVEAESSLEQNQTSNFNSKTGAQLVADGQMPDLCCLPISLRCQYLRNIKLPRQLTHFRLGVVNQKIYIPKLDFINKNLEFRTQSSEFRIQYDWAISRRQQAESRMQKRKVSCYQAFKLLYFTFNYV
ncbi:hypothetical protein NSTC745_03850 [Nostoc sp. DSM 114161]